MWGVTVGRHTPVASAVTGHLQEPAARLKLGEVTPGEVCPAGRARAQGGAV